MITTGTPARRRPVSRPAAMLAAMALALLGMLVTPAPAWADAPGEVEVVDPAGVLDRDVVIEHARSLDFYSPADVVVVAIDSGGDPVDLNIKVRDLAFAEHQDWLSPDHRYWRDGLLIFAVDPSARQVGTYFGENFDFSDTGQAAVQEAAKDDFRHGQWTDGTLLALDELAATVDRPWYRSTVTYVVGGGVLLAGGAVLGRRVRRGRRVRAEYTDARALYAEVTTEIDELDINATTIPADSPFGARVLEEYRKFAATHKKATALGAELEDVKPSQFRTSSVGTKVTTFADSVESADRIAELVENASAILNKSATWPEAWDREVRPVREDVENASHLVGKAPELADSATATELLEGATQASTDLDELTQAMHADAVEPDSALARLDEITAQLGELAERHANAMIAHYARNKGEEKRMRSSMRSHRSYGYGDGPSYVRSTNSGSTATSVSALTFGYLSAQSAIDASRSSSSSSSSSSSGGSSSFSGSGSSSSF